MTKHQLAYRKALIDKGLPEVYAHMAAENARLILEPADSLPRLIDSYFSWGDTSQGVDFWFTVWLEAGSYEPN